MAEKIFGIIPARYNSTRFPGKLLTPIQGKSLLQRTYENASLASSLDQIIIATDDDNIYQHAQDFGAQVVMTPSTCPTGTDRLADVIINHPWLLDASAIVNIQGDEPCIHPSAINLVAEILIKDPIASMSTVVTLLKDEKEALLSSVVKCVIDKNMNALYFSRALIPSNKSHSYMKDTVYYRHVGLYAYRPSFILEYRQLPATPLQLAEDLEQLKVLEHGYRIKVAVIDEDSIGVDIPEDIKKVEQWLCKQNSFL